MSEIEMKVRGFLAKYFRKHELQNDEDMFTLGFVNSLFAMQLVMFLEKEFAVRIETKDLNIENFRTINSIIRLIENKKVSV
jgi:methoxymalonate biosynthesis acyl carrier protein